MGAFHVYCLGCGVGFSSENLINRIGWIEQISCVTQNNEIINKVIYDDGYVTKGKFPFFSKSYNVYDFNVKEDINACIFHTDCLKVIQKIMQKNDIYRSYRKAEFYCDYTPSNTENCLNISKIYGKQIMSHWGQSPIFYDNKYKFILPIYYIESPLKNNLNHQRIEKICHKFKSSLTSTPIKTKSSKSTRPSPSKSATLFSEGTKKKGNDGLYWIVITTKTGVKRWKKMIIKIK